jgi:hypothetical protein
MRNLRIHLWHILLFVIVAAGAASAQDMEVRPPAPDEMFVRPGAEPSLRFEVDGTEAGRRLSYEVVDYAGKTARTGAARVEDGAVEVEVSLTRGYYALRFPAADAEFGVVALPGPDEGRGEFFCIDAALSWLQPPGESRRGLVRGLRRCGIAMARERLSWGQVNPAPERWNWESDRKYDALRSQYRSANLPILEVFHSTPGWMEQVGPYPRSLVTTARSWRKIARHWRGAWGALEVWNEPDISFGGNLPADRYVPLVETLSRVMPRSADGPRLVGGVFAHYNRAYLDLAARNGLLDAVDVISFHTYGRAGGMQQLVGRYQDWLRDNDRPGMPLWITESGRPWRKGPGRPPRGEDALSALDITMKAIEAKACGVDRYFAFVYPYYEEHTNNFGMMDADATPLRSMAAYAWAASVLADSSYLGDLTLESDALERARVFARGDDAVVVLYTGDSAAEKTVTLPCEPERMLGIDGRPLEASGRRAPVPDGLAYAIVERGKLTGHVERETEAMRLNRERDRKPPKRPEQGPVVLQHLPDLDRLSATSEGYVVPRGADSPLSVKMRLSNLSRDARKTRLAMKSAVDPVREVELQGGSHRTVTYDVPLERVGRGAEFTTLEVTARGNFAAETCAVNVRRVPTLQSLLKSFEERRQVEELRELDRWQRSVVGGAELEMSVSDAGWSFTVDFPEELDRWAYPRLRLPDDIDMGSYDGLVLRARCRREGVMRVMLWESHEGRRTGVAYLTPQAVVPCDGRWHAAYIRFAELEWSGANQPDPNGRLDLGSVKHISIGINSDADENRLQVSDLYLVSNAE